MALAARLSRRAWSWVQTACSNRSSHHPGGDPGPPPLRASTSWMVRTAAPSANAPILNRRSALGVCRSGGYHSCRPERSVRCAVAQNRPSARRRTIASARQRSCVPEPPARPAPRARETQKTAIIGRPQQRSAVRGPNVSMISAAVTCGESRKRCSAISPARACHQPVTRPAIRGDNAVKKPGSALGPPDIPKTPYRLAMHQAVLLSKSASSSINTTWHNIYQMCKPPRR